MIKPKLKQRHLEIFRTVMATNSLTAAAKHLGVSQPNLSVAIKRLEDQLGISLFARISGRMIPTEEARLILTEVERVHQQSEMLSEAVYAIAKGKGTTFRFGATPSIGTRLVPKAVRQLQLKEAAATYYCDSLSQRDVRDYLLFGQGSCVATIATVEDPLIETVEIARSHLVCVVPEGHRLAARSSVSPRDIAGEPLISFAPATTHGIHIDETFRRWNVTRETSVFVHFAEAALSFAVEGIGVTILDAFSAMDCRSRGLVALPLENSVEITAYLHFYRLRPRPVAADALLSELRSIAASV
ncbi:LysR family transcriptional regulator [Roseibium suaedae]|uniref:Transcriptional regulator, LysR family n=1 Tax=Roseibium suaedae TaxID=735517 RepID=A0A1M7BHF4_9HYPH|nr:LysR family transcriptional regulator [Roseibium suaedae]SHL54377.1 transcriptional regulator, LysR family [Roseibium suaedae]